jgi:hypothetical protein
VPLHQASALQRDLALLGFETPLSWSVCMSVADQGSDRDLPTAALCPLAMVGKLDLVPPEPPNEVRAPAVLIAALGHGSPGLLPPHDRRGHPGRPRGPPQRA